MKKNILILLISVWAAFNIAAQVISTNPVAYWSFENAVEEMNELFLSQYGDVETYWYDYSTLTNSEIADDLFGAALKFNFTSPHVVTNSNPLAGATNGTISLWVKFENVDGQYRGLFSHYVNAEALPIDNWAINLNGSAKVFDFRSAGKAGYCTDVTVVANQWYHLVYSWEKTSETTTQYNYYIDNVRQAQSRVLTENYTDGADESSILKFGEDRDTKRRPRAIIDEIVLFDVTLTTEQIDSIYTGGLAGEPFQRAILDSISVTPETDELFVGQSRRLITELFPDNASTRGGFTYTTSDPSIVLVDTAGQYSCLAEGTATIKKIFNADNSIQDSCIVTVKAQQSSLDVFPVAYWPMETEENYSSTYDWISNIKANWTSSSNNWEQEGFWWSAEYEYGGSYLKTESNPIKGVTEGTVMAWVKIRETDDQYRGLITLNSADYGNWGFSKHSDNKFDARLNNNSMKSDNDIIANQWYHVAITFKENPTGDSSYCGFYIDGVLQSSSKKIAGTFSEAKNDPAVWVFGNDRNLSNRVPRASLDDVAMFDNALTQAQIQSIVEDKTPLSVLLGLLPDLAPSVVNHSRVQYDYDLGKRWSPVLENWGGISPETNGEISWDTKPEATDRGSNSGMNNANRDFVTSEDEITFEHVLDNGEWKVLMNFGDANAATSGTVVEMEGQVVSPAGGISSSSGEIVALEETVNITDGKLTITLSNTTEAWKWTRLTIRRIDTEGRIGTLQTVDGEPIRAAPMTYGKTYPLPTAYAHDVNNWLAFKDYHYNSIRVTWVGAFASMQNRDMWTDDEIVENFSQVVAAAEKAEMTAIINYHNVGEQDGRNPNGPNYDMELLERFWRIIATNFGNNPRVIFELQNEPSFSFSGYTKPEFKLRFLEIYNMVREIAPETQLIVFSPSPFAWIDDLILNYYDDLDWDYTTAGYHLYSGSNSAPIQRAAELARAVCTEYDFNVNIPGYQRPVDGFEEPHQAMENIEQGWMDWGTHQSPLLSDAWLIPDALEKGYEWWNESEAKINWVTPTSSSLIFEGENMDVRIATSGSVTVSELKLFINGNFVGVDTEAPYEWNSDLLNNLEAGNYVLRVELTDNTGGVKYDHLDISVLHGNETNLEIIHPEATAWVCKDGARGHTEPTLKQYLGLDKDKDYRSYIRFNLQDTNLISFEDARLRLFNADTSDEGWVIVHELLDDNWDEETVSYESGPKTKGYPGRETEIKGDGNEAMTQFWHKDAWVEYDVTEFVQQQLADDSVVTFLVSNLYDNVNNRFDNNYRSNETFTFGSRTHENKPQLILGGVEKVKIPIETLVLNADSIDIKVGVVRRLAYMYMPIEADTSLGFVWSTEDESIATVTNGVIEGVSAGQTLVTISYNSVVMDRCVVTVTNPINAVTENSLSNVSIYPNPASTEIIIESNGHTINNVQILSISGSLVKNYTDTFMKTATINLEGVANGLYLVRITGDDNKQTIQKINVINRN